MHYSCTRRLAVEITADKDAGHAVGSILTRVKDVEQQYVAIFEEELVKTSVAPALVLVPQSEETRDALKFRGLILWRLGVDLDPHAVNP
jgi:hypothetical protein